MPTPTRAKRAQPQPDDTAPSLGSEEQVAGPGKPIAETSDFRHLTILMRLVEGAWALAVYEDFNVVERVTAELRSALAPLPAIEISLINKTPDPLAIIRSLSKDETEQSEAPVISFTGVGSSFPDI